MDRKKITLIKGNQKAFLLETDGVQNCYQDIKINEYSKLDFELMKKSDKWDFFEGSGASCEVNGRMYCIWGEGALEKERTSSNSISIPVSLKEIWCKLEKQYIKAANINTPSSEFDHIDKHMVVLLGKSKDPLIINDATVTAPYPVGTAQYLFWCLLYGSGWTLDNRFTGTWPDGVHDLETDKKNVLENLNQVQSFFGGMILWDSKNKRVALVDEKKYQQYSGFEVRYRKNMKGITRQENRSIATRIYPYGNNNLNIAAVNGGKEYLDNFLYTSEVLEKTINNNDIYSQGSLLAWAKLQSEKLGRPRYNYSADLLILSDNTGYTTPQPEVGHLGRIVDSEVVGTPVTQRILGVRRNVFREYDCQVEIGEVATTFEKTFKEILKAKDFIKDTVSGIGRIPGRIIQGKTPALEKSDLHWSGITTGISTDLTAFKTDTTSKITGINSTVTDIKGNISSLQQTATSLSTRITNAQGDISTLKQTATSIQTQVTNIKGDISTITQTATKIESRVKSAEGNISTLTQTATNITSEVTSIKGWKSTIDQSAERIKLVVDGNGIRPAEIIASINSSGSTVKISADRVDITGLVTLKSLNSDGATVIHGDRISTGTLSTTKLKFSESSGVNAYFYNLNVYKLIINGNGLFSYGGRTVNKRIVSGMSGYFLGSA